MVEQRMASFAPPERVRAYGPAPPIRRFWDRFRGKDVVVETEEETEEDVLVELASELEADGGMPGKTPEERIEASLEALERFLDSGSTRSRGPFRHHVRRLLDFVSEADLNEDQQDRLTVLEERAAD